MMSNNLNNPNMAYTYPNPSSNSTNYNPYRQLAMDPVMNGHTRWGGEPFPHSLTTAAIHPSSPYAQHPSTGPKTQLVSSIEEARALRVDFDGSLLVCVNVNNGEVYSKQMLQNGTVLFSKGTLTPETNIGAVPVSSPSANEFESINARLAAIEAKFTEMEGAKHHVRNKSATTDANVPKQPEPASNPKTNGK